MDDLSEKLAELLSNPKSLEMVKSIAGSLMSEKKEQEQNEDTEDTDDTDDKDSSSNLSSLFSLLGSGGNNPLSGIDPSIILKLTKALGSSTVDEKNYNLLMALKPHLSPKRREKIDTVMSMMKISKIAMTFFDK